MADDAVFVVTDPKGTADVLLERMERVVPGSVNELDRRRLEKLDFRDQMAVPVVVEIGEAGTVPDALRW